MPRDKAGLDPIDQVVQLLMAQSNSQTSTLYTYKRLEHDAPSSAGGKHQAAIPMGGSVVARAKKDFLVVLTLPVLGR
jgi:hypothetical protein